MPLTRSMSASFFQMPSPPMTPTMTKSAMMRVQFALVIDEPMSVEAIMPGMRARFARIRKLDIFISSRLPRGCIVESWLINDVKYQFPGNAVVKFRVMGLDEGTTYEIRFQGVSTGGSPTPGTYTIPGPTPPTNGVAWRWNNN